MCRSYNKGIDPIGRYRLKIDVDVIHKDKTISLEFDVQGGQIFKIRQYFFDEPVTQL